MLGFLGMNLVHSRNRNRTGYGSRGVRRPKGSKERGGEGRNYAGARPSGHEINGGFETNMIYIKTKTPLVSVWRIVYGG